MMRWTLNYVRCYKLYNILCKIGNLIYPALLIKVVPISSTMYELRSELSVVSF